MLCLQHPGILGLVCRATYPELRDTTRREFLSIVTDQLYMKEGRDYTFNRAENHFRFTNGSEVLFRSLDDPDKFKSLNLGFFYIDEASEANEEIFLMLQGRLRQKGVRRCGYMTSNPEGHNWLWKWFVATQKPGYAFFHAPTTENTHLPQDYIEALMQYPENWRRRYMEGSFDVFEGQVYPMFDYDIHTIDPFDIRHWEIVETIDHGVRNPTAYLQAAVDPDGNIYICDEHYQAGQLVSHHANVIQSKRKGKKISYTIIDPACKQTNGINGMSVIDEYIDCGVHPTPGNNDVIAGINRVSEFLKIDPLTNKPKLFIFRTCENLINELQQYKWEKLKPGKDQNEPEKPVKVNDHAADALRYLIMSRPEPWASGIVQAIAPASTVNKSKMFDSQGRHYSEIEDSQDEESAWLGDWGR